MKKLTSIKDDIHSKTLNDTHKQFECYDCYKYIDQNWHKHAELIYATSNAETWQEIKYQLWMRLKESI